MRPQIQVAPLVKIILDQIQEPQDPVHVTVFGIIRIGYDRLEYPLHRQDGDQVEPESHHGKEIPSGDHPELDDLQSGFRISVRQVEADVEVSQEEKVGEGAYSLDRPKK